MKRSLTWIAVGLSILSAVDADADVPLSAAGDGHDTIPVYVNGRGPYPFILDSGADGSAVYGWFAEQEHLPKAQQGEQQLSGQTGVANVSMYQLDELALDGHNLRHATAFGLPNRHDGGREAGVLGNDFMDGSIVAYDFPCHRVEIHAKPANMDKIVGPGLPPIEAGIDEGTTVLTLPVAVNGFTGIAVLDTGSRDTRLTTSFAKAAGIDASSKQFQDGVAIFGANSNKMIPRNGPVGRIGFGGIEIADARAQVIDLPMLEADFGGKPAMLLGVDLLGRYRLLYDHEARKIWIRPSSCKAPE